MLAFGLRRSLLVLRCGFLWLLAGLLLSALWGTTSLKLYDFLSNGDGVLLVDEELLDGTSLGRVDSNVDLVSLNGSDLFILLNVVADLCML